MKSLFKRGGLYDEEGKIADEPVSQLLFPAALLIESSRFEEGLVK